jgi:hypothetical protein
MSLTIGVVSFSIGVGRREPSRGLRHKQWQSKRSITQDDHDRALVERYDAHAEAFRQLWAPPLRLASLRAFAAVMERVRVQRQAALSRLDTLGR